MTPSDDAAASARGGGSAAIWRCSSISVASASAADVVMSTVAESVPCSASIRRSAARRTGSAEPSASTTLSVGPSTIIVATPWRCISTCAHVTAGEPGSDDLAHLRHRGGAEAERGDAARTVRAEHVADAEPFADDEHGRIDLAGRPRYRRHDDGDLGNAGDHRRSAELGDDARVARLAARAEQAGRGDRRDLLADRQAWLRLELPVAAPGEQLGVEPADVVDHVVDRVEHRGCEQTGRSGELRVARAQSVRSSRGHRRSGRVRRTARRRRARARPRSAHRSTASAPRRRSHRVRGSSSAAPVGRVSSRPTRVVASPGAGMSATLPAAYARRPMSSSRVPYLTAKLQGFGTTIFAEMSALAIVDRRGEPRPGLPGHGRATRGARRGPARRSTTGYNQYPPGPGYPVLRQAIAEHQQRFWGLTYDPDTEIFVTTGCHRGARRGAARAVRHRRRGGRARADVRQLPGVHRARRRGRRSSSRCDRRTTTSTSTRCARRSRRRRSCC